MVLFNLSYTKHFLWFCGSKWKLFLLCIKISVCNSSPVIFLSAVILRMRSGRRVRDTFGTVTEYVIAHVYRFWSVGHSSYSDVSE